MVNMGNLEIIVRDDNNNVISTHKFTEIPEVREGILYINTGDRTYGYKSWGSYVVSESGDDD